MKSKIYLFVTVILLSFNINGEETKHEGSTTIELTTNPDKLGQCPRIPNYIPIECTYNYGILQFSFEYDLGIIDVTITNITTGSYETRTINTSYGNAIINVSQDSGEYILTITSQTESYYGYYLL